MSGIGAIGGPKLSSLSSLTEKMEVSDPSISLSINEEAVAKFI